MHSNTQMKPTLLVKRSFFHGIISLYILIFYLHPSYAADNMSSMVGAEISMTKFFLQRDYRQETFTYMAYLRVASALMEKKYLEYNDSAFGFIATQSPVQENKVSITCN